LICISFMARDGEHFFHVFLNHLDFFLWRLCLVSSFAHSLGHWFWRSFFFFFLSSLYIVVVSPLPDV
jgi:hypothetical protein